ncbi:MAG: hypothetical protein FD180_2329 [Planctomycetota bacterium]|nr:MAG: hypothetical protein FD180_2329 [Planctomycetota bacterium]
MDDQLTEQIIAAAIEVHRILGPGLLEQVYEEALCIEFRLRGIPFERQKPARIVYKGIGIKGQRIDLVAFLEIVVELKSQKPNEELFLGQALAHLKASDLKTGLILNFWFPRLVSGIQRVAG